MNILCPASGFAACAIGACATSVTPMATAIAIIRSLPGRIPAAVGGKIISSLDHIGAAEDSADTAASVARLPRRERGSSAPAGPGSRLDRALATRAVAIALFGGLVAVSLALKLRGLGRDYWIDEGLSVGIGSHPLTQIPALMKMDGSPPLYYMLIHAWMGWFGTSEADTQSLSIVFALLCIPAAFWAGLTMFGRRAAWAAAALAAINPFLTWHSFEARMYSLVPLLGLLTATAFVKTFVDRRRRWLPVFAVLQAVMLYTHNWSFFFAAATVVALAILVRRSEEPRPLLRDAALAYGGVFLLYLPWLPTLLFQVRHTGAPWSFRPSPYRLIFEGTTVAGSSTQAVAIALGAGAGLSALARSGRRREHAALQALCVIAVGTILLAWVGSQISPAW